VYLLGRFTGVGLWKATLMVELCADAVDEMQSWIEGGTRGEGGSGGWRGHVDRPVGRLSLGRSVCVGGGMCGLCFKRKGKEEHDWPTGAAGFAGVSVAVYQRMTREMAEQWY
jgi:hypothetical protein